MPPDPPRTLAPAARAENAFGNLFSPPNHKNVARFLPGGLLLRAQDKTKNVVAVFFFCFIQLCDSRKIHYVTFELLVFT